MQAPDARTQRTRLRGRERDVHPTRASLGDEHQGLPVAALQALDRYACRRVAFDDDRLERVAERGCNRDLRTFVDLEEVDERPQHAVEVGEVLAAGGGMGFVERRGEHLGPRPPA